MNVVFPTLPNETNSKRRAVGSPILRAARSTARPRLPTAPEFFQTKRARRPHRSSMVSESDLCGVIELPKAQILEPASAARVCFEISRNIVAPARANIQRFYLQEP
jgi:hypothetical protein